MVVVCLIPSYMFPVYCVIVTKNSKTKIQVQCYLHSTNFQVFNCSTSCIKREKNQKKTSLLSNIRLSQYFRGLNNTPVKHFNSRIGFFPLQFLYKIMQLWTHATHILRTHGIYWSCSSLPFGLCVCTCNVSNHSGTPHHQIHA